MADETILVVDADPELDGKISSALEAEGYLVFACSSHVVTEELVNRYKPSLIYIKPLSPNAAGFQPCRTIHTMPNIQHIPIILLASLKKALEPQHAEYYGIVDSLKLSFTIEELLTKTSSVIASVKTHVEPEPELEPEPEQSEGDAFLSFEKVATVTEPDAAEEKPVAEELDVLPQPSAEQEALTSESVHTPLIEEKRAPREFEIQKPSPSKHSLSRRASRQSRLQRPSLLPWLIGLLILVSLGGGVFFAYQHFMPSQRPAVSEPKKAALPVAPEQKEAGTPPPVSPVAAPEPMTPSQAPKPAAPAGKSAPVLKNPSYSVQVGAYKTEEIAAVLVKKLQGKGYEAFIEKGVTKDNSPILRVLIGNFPDRKAAVKLAAEIQEKEQLKTTIFTD